MSKSQPEFQSLRNMRDNSLLLSIANEYIGEKVFLSKIGNEIKKNLAALKDDINFLKKQFPGKFATEVNTDKILRSLDSTAEEMLSGKDEVKKDCVSGKLGAALSNDVETMTEAIEKIWQQVKGSDIKYSKADFINSLFDRLNLVSGAASLFSKTVKILFAALIVFLAVFSFLFFTMEKESTFLKENVKIMASIEEKESILKDLERKKAEVRKDLAALDSDELLRKDKIKIIDLETRIQQYNQEIHIIEGQIESRRRMIEENEQRLEDVRSKSFMERLLKE